MITKPYKDSIILWQEDPEDGVAEKPILVEPYSDVISLTQGDNSISLNFHHVNELIKVLKQVSKQ